LSPTIKYPVFPPSPLSADGPVDAIEFISSADVYVTALGLYPGKSSVSTGAAENGSKVELTKEAKKSSVQTSGEDVPNKNKKIAAPGKSKINYFSALFILSLSTVY